MVKLVIRFGDLTESKKEEMANSGFNLEWFKPDTIIDIIEIPELSNWEID